MRVKPGGEVIFIRVIYSSSEVTTPMTSVRDTLKKTWAHVVTTHDLSSELNSFFSAEFPSGTVQNSSWLVEKKNNFLHEPFL